MKDFVKYLKVGGGFLSAEETDVILSVLGELFKHEGYPKKGTFILEGQESIRRPVRLIDFDYLGGKKTGFAGQNHDSRYLAEDVLYQASTYLREDDRSAITYFCNTPQIMMLETDNGRFTCAHFADNGLFDEQAIVYTAVMVTLNLLRPEDKILAKNVRKTLIERAERSPELLVVRDFVKELFEKEDSTDEIKAWRKVEHKKEYF